MAWYAVRSVYLFGKKRDGRNIFEERMVCFRVDSEDELWEKAERESEHYAKILRLEVHPDQEAYEQDGDDLIDGYEVWSKLFESNESLDEFYGSRYEKYEYHPGPW